MPSQNHVIRHVRYGHHVTLPEGRITVDGDDLMTLLQIYRRAGAIVKIDGDTQFILTALRPTLIGKSAVNHRRVSDARHPQGHGLFRK